MTEELKKGNEEKSPELKSSEVKAVEVSGEKPEGKDNIIFVGIKPFMNYVTGVVMQFQNKGQDEVIVSARGKFISKAVDVVEVARRTFLKDENIQIKDIKISSEQFENKEGKRIFVSAIEVLLVKG
jgi:DNA-binding protein